MSGTCIVCLGDLGDGSTDPQGHYTPSAKSPIREGDAESVTTASLNRENANQNENNTELIAHLKPCGHNLHNDCLTPWVERANSCPICRARFYTVGLSTKVGGEVIRTYDVQDRSQVADFDPSMFLEEVDDNDDTEPCQVCEEDDNEDVLMYCDQCNRLFHSYCVGLQEIPVGHWFCDDCRAQRDVNPRHPCPPRGTRSQSGPSRRRTRGQQRRFRSQNQATDASWTRVWQSVWDRLNLDLDFPDEEEAAATAIRRHRQHNDINRREHEAWQLRRRIAEMQGGGDSRFRDTEASLLDHQHTSAFQTARNHTSRTRHHPGTPEQETTEDQLAWEAFDQARQEELDPEQSSNPNRRKRKSVSASPAELQTDDYENKRSRTSRMHDAENASGSAASSRLRRPVPRRVSPLASPLVAENNTPGPSFLQSLLKEVEDSSAPNNPRGGFYRQSPLNAPSPITISEHQSPQPSSPALSPAPSNHSSPRAMSATPPPTYSRSNSPTGLSSSIQPIFSSSDLYPSRSSPDPPSVLTNGRSSRIPVGGGWLAQPTRHPSPPLSRPRSSESSPTRPCLSFNAKSDVQKMVSSALKPYYHKKTISKDQYTTINRDISRKLYDQIGDFEALGIEGRAKWEKVAGDEVGRAVATLKDSSRVNQISGGEMLEVTS
ncbi:hypothetical protein GJ744_002831 [Endocarpon pusillum]|uniref:PHD and RING finger domain-containing protein n=1 Tax=Endocarpon pusillum TaxID=364733 RepID=A0A8H7ABG8_9EURO|nr:hypothetical protein GJ744_002831 [Endocarpon pusillum]